MLAGSLHDAPVSDTDVDMIMRLGGVTCNDEVTAQELPNAIAIMINIKNSKNPSLGLSCPAGAASAWQGKWWGGNLKGLVYKTKVLVPDVVDFITSTGGMNVMSYDLSNDPTRTPQGPRRASRTQ